LANERLEGGRINVLAFGKNPGGYEILWVQNFGRPKGRERL
jgi:hypothetical protein